MSAPRFFVTLPLAPALVGSEVTLPEAAAHHALRVRRLMAGDALVLFDGHGGEYAATLVHAGKREARVRIDALAEGVAEPARKIVLAQALVASDGMDAIVRHAVELGAAALQPLVTARSARFPPGAQGAKRIAHWRAIAVAACEQCGRNRIPAVADPLALDGWLAHRSAGRAGIVLAPGAVAALHEVRAAAGDVDLLVGPEGGFSPDEIRLAIDRGFVAAGMGPRILRAETAALAALAVVNTLVGDRR